MKGRKADGGKVMPQKEPKSYAGTDSNVEKEAEEKKKGGRACRAAGGSVDGEKASRRMDRPGRKRGGRAMADKAPLSTASKITSAGAHKTSDTGNAEDGP